MGETLRDQLLKAGFQAPRQQRKPARKRNPRPVAEGEVDLASAYAARARAEASRKADNKRMKKKRDDRRRKQNLALAELLDGCVLNDAEADIARYFMDNDRITRVYVTAGQRDQLAGGQIGIVKLRRRYLLVDQAVLTQAAAIKPDAVVDLSQEADADD